jgi:HemY protein
MKFGLIVVLTLAIGSLAAHFLLQDNGYVLFHFRGYAVEMSVPVLLFLLFVTYLIVRLIAAIWRSPRQLGEAVERARQQRTGNQINQGFIALSDGRLSRGERLLTKSARHSETPMLQYLEAARVAQMQGDRERRDGWLKMAYDQGEDAANAVLLTQAELQLAEDENEQARASLARILDSQPGHPEALKLQARLCYRDKDWAGLAELLPALRRRKNVAGTQLDEWTRQAYAALLAEPGIDRQRIDDLWRILPKSLRKDSSLIASRTQALAAHGEAVAAESEIRKALKFRWDPALVLLYGHLKLDNVDAQLRHAEAWLRDRPEDPELLLTAGRICVRNQLWGKARSYLESSLAIRPSPEAYNELGQLMLNIGEDGSATDAFRKGLILSSGLPGVPRLESSGT